MSLLLCGSSNSSRKRILSWMYLRLIWGRTFIPPLSFSLPPPSSPSLLLLSHSVSLQSLINPSVSCLQATSYWDGKREREREREGERERGRERKRERERGRERNKICLGSSKRSQANWPSICLFSTKVLSLSFDILHTMSRTVWNSNYKNLCSIPPLKYGIVGGINIHIKQTSHTYIKTKGNCPLKALT